MPALPGEYLDGIHYRSRMKKFFVKGFIFVLPLILLLAFIEFRLSKIPNGYTTKKNFFEQRIAEYEVVNTGTSHTLMSINPRYLDGKAYNLAYLGQSLYYDAQLISRYLDRMQNLKLLIVPVSYQSLQYRMSNNRLHGWRANFYSRHYGFPDEDGNSGWRKPGNYSLIALYGIDETRSYIRGGFTPRLEIKIDENGWGDMGYVSNLSERNVRARISNHHASMKPEVIGENKGTLENLFDKLRAKNVSIVIVTTPVSQVYASKMLPENLFRMQEGIEYLRHKYGIEYFNYMYDQRFVAEDFLDADHLNARGAEKFSKIINDDFVKRYIYNHRRVNQPHE